VNRLGNLALLALFVVPGVANAADRIRIRDREVIAVKFDDAISTKTTHGGDRFSATVDGDRDLPDGTKLVGRVREIRQKDGDNPACAELEFTELVLPNGDRVDIHAYPISLDSKSVTKGKDGHLEAKKGPRRDQVVLGAAAGGLLLGTIFHKPFEGTVLGALGGILVAETGSLNTNSDQIVQKGQKMGAGFDGQVYVDLDSRDSRSDSRDSQDSRDLRVEYKDHEVRFDRDVLPYRAGSSVMVPLDAMAKELGLDVTRSGDSIFYLEDEDNSLKLEQNVTDGRLNGRRISLPQAVVAKGGVIYVPIEAFAAIKRDSLSVNGTRVSSQA